MSSYGSFYFLTLQRQIHSSCFRGMCHNEASEFMLMTFNCFSFQVAQYIKFEIPVLDSFVQKLKEEEEREIKKLTRK